MRDRAHLFAIVEPEPCGSVTTYALVFTDLGEGKERLFRQRLLVIAQTVDSAHSAGDQSLIPGSGTSPGERNGHPVKYSCLKNSMDRGIW